MLAMDHPRGRGKDRIDSHEVLILTVGGKTVILDPMANTVIPHDLSEVLQHTSLAREKDNPDERYVERGYHLYDTQFWYSRVYKYIIRNDINRSLLLWRKNKYLKPMTE